MPGEKIPISPYCMYVQQLAPDNPHRIYHDTVYGFPVSDDHVLFERLSLEINQAGLSWLTILNKTPHFRRAFQGFDIPIVARYTEPDVARLMADATIIRNRRKILAVIHNANVILAIQQQWGSFVGWLNHHHPQPLADWLSLFKQTFHFVGREIVNEFLMSTGYLPGAHIPECPVFPLLDKAVLHPLE